MTFKFTSRISCQLLSCALSLVPLTHSFANTAAARSHDSANNTLVNFTLTGIENEPALENAKSALINLRQLHLSSQVDSNAIFNIYKDAPKAIKDALEPFGYFHARVQTHYTHTSRWEMTFKVTPGPRSKVSKVNLNIIGQGKHDPHFQNLKKHFPIKAGHFFELKNFNEGNSKLFQIAANRGYFSAKTQRTHITVNLNKQNVAIDNIFDTGPRSRFGKTTFSQTPFSLKFLRKFLTYKEGQFYNANKMHQAQDNLNNTNYFSLVNITPSIKANDKANIPMKVDLTLRKRREYLLGLGYGTDTSIRGSVGIRYHWLNQWGHYADINTQGSLVNYSLVGAYHIPWPDPTRDRLSILGGIGRINMNSGNSTAEKISLVYRHIWRRWETSLSVSALNENYDIRNLPKTTARLIYFHANSSYFSVKNRINPKNGYRIALNLTGTPQPLSTTAGFTQAEINGKWVHFLFKNQQIVTRLNYANTIIDNINQLPLSLQLLAGGTQTIRGYRFQSIGPGHEMLIGSIELRQRLFSQFYLAGFYDFGNVSDTSPIRDLKRSAGSGLVFRSPIGIIQAGVAWRINHGVHGPGFYFDMGPEL
jgi:translocation and assembly module TamA